MATPMLSLCGVSIQIWIYDHKIRRHRRCMLVFALLYLSSCVVINTNILLDFLLTERLEGEVILVTLRT